MQMSDELADFIIEMEVIGREKNEVKSNSKKKRKNPEKKQFSVRNENFFKCCRKYARYNKRKYKLERYCERANIIESIMPDIAICVVRFSFHIWRYRSHLGNEKEKNAFNANEEKNANKKKLEWKKINTYRHCAQL